jgi:hypothetical protein
LRHTQLQYIFGGRPDTTPEVAEHVIRIGSPTSIGYSDLKWTSRLHRYTSWGQSAHTFVYVVEMASIYRGNEETFVLTNLSGLSALSSSKDTAVARPALPLQSLANLTLGLSLPASPNSGLDCELWT